jgi:predicted cupin superfamily sugar epimerase
LSAKLSASDVIRLLDLKPHPEGGYFRETFRDLLLIWPSPGAGRSNDDGGRAASTVAYFLLSRGQRSHWHRVDAVETWFWHAGAPLELEVADRDGRIERVTLGGDLAAGERPHAIVPAHAWQAAQSCGDWTLCSVTVAPGFDFKRFELAPTGWAP